jgi:hypothetical protein
MHYKTQVFSLIRTIKKIRRSPQAVQMAKQWCPMAAIVGIVMKWKYLLASLNCLFHCQNKSEWHGVQTREGKLSVLKIFISNQ